MNFNVCFSSSKCRTVSLLYFTSFVYLDCTMHIKGIVSDLGDFGKSSSHPGYKMCTCTHSTAGCSATGQQHIHQSTLPLDSDWKKAPLILIGQRFTSQSDNQKSHLCEVSGASSQKQAKVSGPLL